MTTEEKLEHFQSFCIQDARKQGAKLLDNYTAQLERQLNEHKEDAKRQASIQLQLEGEKIKQDTNKKLAIEQIALRRVLNQKHQELKEKLFVEVRSLLEHFMTTPAYEQLLKDYILQAMKVSGEEELTIYIDHADKSRLKALAHELNIPLTLSEYSFLGGIRAVIPSKNILIDQSFATRLEEAEHSFQFHIHAGGTING